MLELADDLARLRRELKSLRERAASLTPDEGGNEEPSERPPHY